MFFHLFPDTIKDGLQALTLGHSHGDTWVPPPGRGSSSNSPRGPGKRLHGGLNQVKLM